MSRWILLLPSLCLILPVSAETIKKCQDAEGKWHYGDHAAFECEQSGRITEIDEAGRKVREIEAPPTQEELDAKLRVKRQQSEQERAEAAQKRLDQRLLVTYDSSESILQTRDALLAAIDSAIEADRTLRDRLMDELNKLRSGGEAADSAQLESIKREIAAFDDAISDRLAKREIAKNKYDAHHLRYKELTGN